MDIDTRTLACWAENAWDDAPAAANTLRQQLRLMERNAANLFSAGSIGSVSKNSASQSYAGAGFGRFSVAQIQQGFRMLIELCDQYLQKAKCLNNTFNQYPANCEASWFNSMFGPGNTNGWPPFAEDSDYAVWFFMNQNLGNPADTYECDLSDLRLRPTIAPGLVVTW